MALLACRHLSINVLVFFLVLGVSAAYLGGDRGRKATTTLGGFEPVDVNDPHIQELAQFAVSELNKIENTQLRFVRVVRGATQVVAGANYVLVIAAEDGGVTSNYQAVVWEKVWENFKELTAFKRVV